MDRGGVQLAFFMAGSMAPGTGFAALLAVLCDAKKAAAAKCPANVIVVDNLADGWVNGTGKSSARTGR